MFRASNLFIFGLSLLNVRTRNNVNFLLYPCNFLHCGEFLFIHSFSWFVRFFPASVMLKRSASIHAENHHMKNRKSIYFGIVIKHATRYKHHHCTFDIRPMCPMSIVAIFGPYMFAHETYKHMHAMALSAHSSRWKLNTEEKQKKFDSIFLK